MGVFDEFSAWLAGGLLAFFLVVFFLVSNHQKIAEYMDWVFYRLFGEMKTRQEIKNRERLYRKQEQRQREMQRQSLRRYSDDKYRHDNRRR